EHMATEVTERVPCRIARFRQLPTLAAALTLLLLDLDVSAAPLVSWPKIEASFSITNSISDPFDYTVADVRVQIVQPDSSTVSLPAFFDGGTTWRVRHTPFAPGQYAVTG